MIKKINKAVLILATIVLCSCGDYLDVKPFGKVIPKTPEEFASLLHKRLYQIDYGNDQHSIGNVSEVLDITMYADDFEASLDKDGRNNKVSVSQDLSRTTMFNKYRELYEIIRDCNIVIENVKPDSYNSSESVLSAAYALRGVCYFQLLKQFCEAPNNLNTQKGLPIVLNFDIEAMPKRSPMIDVVRVIENDFKSSLQYKPDPEFRFSKEVVKGYLARLYFWTEQWKEAKDLSLNIIAEKPILEGKEYTDMLDTLYNSLGNTILRAPIYEDPSKKQENETNLRNLRSRPVSKRYIDCFYNEKDNDIRYTHFISDKRESNKKLYVNMRSAEFLLIAAECEYHLGNNSNALNLINQLRAKRISNYQNLDMNNIPELRDSEIIKVDATGKPLTKLINLILTERRKELFQEGDRWFELKRNGSPEFWQASEGLKYVTLPYMYTYPLPISDLMIVNGLEQNEGYTNVITN